MPPEPRPVLALLLIILAMLSISANFMKLAQSQTYSIMEHGMSRQFDLKHMKPINITDQFRTIDATAYCWFRIQTAEPYIRIYWRWIDPDNKVHSEESHYFSLRYPTPEYLWSRIQIEGTPAANKTGRWLVEVYGFLNATWNPLFTEKFSINPPVYSITVSVSGLPSTYSTRIYSDGKYNVTINSEQPIRFTFGYETTHIISVDELLNGSRGVRYQCKPNTLNVSSAAAYTFNYTTQFYLHLYSAHGQPSGSGWYDQGTTAEISLEPSMSDEAGVRHIFLGWSGDRSSNATSVQIVMDGPKNLTATWKTQYYLKVTSEYGEPKGEDWYDAGSTANFSVTSPIGAIIQRVFNSWEGDYDGVLPYGSIRMENPKTVIATWRTDYIQLYILTGIIAAVASSATIAFRQINKRKRLQAILGSLAKPGSGIEGDKPLPRPEESGVKAAVEELEKMQKDLEMKMKNLRERLASTEKKNR